LYKTDYADLDGNNVTVDEDQFVRLKCDFIISAFGSQVGSPELLQAIQPLTLNKYGTADIDLETMHNKAHPWLFCGGDLIGNGTTVEAVNDGKTAAWYIHKYLQQQYGMLKHFI
jgi:dihydropyrimidine dehydrogenase (NADP+)